MFRPSRNTSWGCPPWYISDVKLRSAARPKVFRSRETGIVGPEPDWGVLYSNIPINTLKKYFDVLDFSDMSFLFPRNGVYQSPKGMVHTSGMTAKHVAAWTNFAHRHGVMFSGKNGYTFPSDVKKVGFKTNKRGHFVTHRHRSNAERKTGINARPLTYEKSTSAELRKAWFHAKERTKFSEFVKSHKCVYPTLHSRLGSSRPPALVLEALQKIYSRTEYDKPLTLQWETGFKETKKPPTKEDKRKEYALRMTDHERSFQSITARLSNAIHDVEKFNKLNDDLQVRIRLIQSDIDKYHSKEPNESLERIRKELLTKYGGDPFEDPWPDEVWSFTRYKTWTVGL
jgi:hypothetical protein